MKRLERMTLLDLHISMKPRYGRIVVTRPCMIKDNLAYHNTNSFPSVKRL